MSKENVTIAYALYRVSIETVGRVKDGIPMQTYKAKQTKMTI